MKALARKAKNPMDIYLNDFEPDPVNEFMQFKHIIKFYKMKCFNIEVIMENELQITSPNNEVALRMYLSMKETNYTVERSFS